MKESVRARGRVAPRETLLVWSVAWAILRDYVARTGSEAETEEVSRLPLQVWRAKEMEEASLPYLRGLQAVGAKRV